MKIREGSSTISLLRCGTRAKGKRYRYYRLWYRQDGKLHRPTFTTEKAARAFAEKKVIELANGATAAHQLTDADAASFARVQQLLQPTGIAPEIAAAQYAEAFDVLKKSNHPPQALITAARDYCERHKPNQHLPTYTQVLAEFLPTKNTDGTRSRQRGDLRQRLTFLEKAWPLPLAHLHAADICRELDRLQARHTWTNRTRNHYRAALSNLINFAKARRHLPREWDEMKFVPKAEERDGAVVIYSPEETAALLAATPADMLPALVLMFFAGIRHREVTGCAQDQVPPLDWRDLNLQTGEAFIGEGKVRTAGNRIAHLPANAIAWLRTRAKRSGPVCPQEDITKRLAAIATAAGVAWKQDAQRRSYISYRLAKTKDLARVSQETGTDPATLRKKYLRPIPQSEALKYFAIRPINAGKANIIPFRRQNGAKKSSPLAISENGKPQSHP